MTRATAKALSASSLILAICLGCSSLGNQKARVESISCIFTSGAKAIKADGNFDAYPPELLIDSLSGQELILASEGIGEKPAVQRLVGSANRGAFETTSSGIAGNEFQSVSIHLDPYNSKSVIIRFTRIYMSNLKGFTSIMKFKEPSQDKAYKTILAPQEITCKRKEMKGHPILTSDYLASPLDGGSIDGGILMNNGWREIDQRIRPLDSR